MTRDCLTCSQSFESRIESHVYCSTKCRHASPLYKEKRQLNNLKRRMSQLEFIRKFKLNLGCSECGYKGHAAALQFDHINPEDKSFNLAQGHMRSMTQILKEIGKCRVLCANCHAIHTFNQKQGGLDAFKS